LLSLPCLAYWQVEFVQSEATRDVHFIATDLRHEAFNVADGGIRLNIQHDSPGKAREANWLPAPKGPFMVAMRLYWPKAEALNGTWKLPPLKRAN
jgi:hypothetical protein